ncbi:interleukin-34 [Esox lucius]|uniref:Interleukin 34 n=1 Tax=Esox lucius TaxID=8010 RepID=A0A3P9A4J3_ESOLU|nr:interleukin-34 [Esox lucius]
MVQSTAWLLGALLGLIWVLPVSMTPTTAQCTSLRTLESKLICRRRYMKHNFPINYTIRVHYEEVLRLSNVTRLRVRVEEEKDLQDVWLLINQEVLKRLLRVLPERHPSYKYTADLEDLFRKVQQLFPPPSDERETPELIEEIYNRVKDPNSKGWRFVTPKSLLDNCYRTMHCLFKDCFPSQDGEQDYCSFSYWRKGRKRQLQDT